MILTISSKDDHEFIVEKPRNTYLFVDDRELSLHGCNLQSLEQYRADNVLESVCKPITENGDEKTERERERENRMYV